MTSERDNFRGVYIEKKRESVSESEKKCILARRVLATHRKTSSDVAATRWEGKESDRDESRAQRWAEHAEDITCLMCVAEQSRAG